MKKSSSPAISLVLFFILCFSLSNSQGQLLKRLKQEVQNRVENKAVNETGSATDKTLDKAKDGITGNGNDKSQKNKSSNNSGNDAGEETTVNNAPVKGMGDYKSYDFVPGDKIIFQPDLSGETDAELPARFTVVKGNTEIQSFNGEKILHINKGGYNIITPLMKNESYLPEQFTLEFDLMYENDKNIFDQFNDFAVQLYPANDDNYEGYGVGEFVIMSNESTVLGKHGTNKIKAGEDIQKILQTNNTWHHIALYFRKNIAKAYIGATRVSATNNFPTVSAKLAFKTDGRYGYKVKNIRLAAGGDDKYNKIVTDGKFITHGILFDVNKSSIKPESMGALNEIVKMMKDHSDLKFEIGGHTDSDGNADANMKLSESRAKAVKDKLAEMGISADRLTTKGFGATKPMDKNDTQEGKANNRRVEFVKV